MAGFSALVDKFQLLIYYIKILFFEGKDGLY